MKVVDIEQAQMVVVQDGVEIPVTSETAWVRLLNGELVKYPTGEEDIYLRKKRTELGVAAVDVAYIMDVSKQAVHQWETRGARPEVVLRLLNLYTYSREEIEFMATRVRRHLPHPWPSTMEVTVVEKEAEEQPTQDSSPLSTL